MIYRVFKIQKGWTLMIFFFDEKITYKDMKSDNFTNYLAKQHYIGKHKYDIKFLENFDEKEIDGKKYYILYHTSEN